VNLREISYTFGRRLACRQGFFSRSSGKLDLDFYRKIHMAYVSKMNAGKKGSALVFSLIVLSFILVSALSIAAVTIKEQRIASTTRMSSVAFQTADSGIEMILQKIYKEAPTGLNDLANKLGGGCNNGVVSFSAAQGSVKASFYEGESGDTLYTSCSADAAWRSRVNTMKSIGIYAGTTRVVEVSITPP
jgi:hypothetical protein